VPGDHDHLQRPGGSAGRLTAVGVAVAVTLLTLAGQFGVGPGAAQAQLNQNVDHNGSSSASRTDSSSGSSGGSGSESSSKASDDTDDWLTIDDSPATSPTHNATPGDHISSPAGTELPKGTGTGKRIVYDISGQRVWLVSAEGTVTRTYLVSGGLDPNLLDPGRYQVYSMSRDATSYNHKSTMQYMVRFANGAHAPIGFHDVPMRANGSLVQSRSELGTPLSSGCIRQWISDARALWDFAEVGTPVVVTA
jgi:lipoprotein-anchoring transpeptidase ErfK/SrfK